MFSREYHTLRQCCWLMSGPDLNLGRWLDSLLRGSRHPNSGRQQGVWTTCMATDTLCVHSNKRTRLKRMGGSVLAHVHIQIFPSFGEWRHPNDGQMIEIHGAFAKFTSMRTSPIYVDRSKTPCARWKHLREPLDHWVEVKYHKSS